MTLTNYDLSDDGVALIRLERAEARNALNTPMLEEILGHLASAREDEQVRVLVISSNDHMGLSAGADVREQLDEQGRLRRMELFSHVYDELVGFPKPTVAACHGACVGGGAEIAVACDLRVGGSNLRLRFPGAALGVPVGPARLVTLCGLSVAKYLLLTSKEIAADEAHRWGLVHKVVAAPRTEEAAPSARRPGRRAPARGRGAAEADAARVGRRRGPLRASRARARSSGSARARACPGLALSLMAALGVERVDDLDRSPCR